MRNVILHPWAETRKQIVQFFFLEYLSVPVKLVYCNYAFLQREGTNKLEIFPKLRGTENY